MPLTENEKRMLRGAIVSDDIHVSEIEELVARCEQNAVKEFEKKLKDGTYHKQLVEQVKSNAKAEERKRIMTGNEYLAGLIKAKEQKATDKERKRILEWIKQRAKDSYFDNGKNKGIVYSIGEKDLAELEKGDA